MNELQVHQSKEMVSPPATLIEASLKLPPRDMVQVRNTLLQLACLSPETARASIYCVPVGKDPDTGLQKFKLGESIRMAEMCQNAFGRMMVDLQIEQRTATSVTVKAMMMDLQTLNIYPGMGTAQFKSEYRFKMAVAAASSIARRNAIMSMVKPYTAAILDEVKATVINGLSEEGSVQKALTSLVKEFEEFGVTEEQCKKAVKQESDPKDKVVMLIGILNGLRDNMFKAEEVFGDIKTPPKSDKPAELTDEQKQKLEEAKRGQK